MHKLARTLLANISDAPPPLAEEENEPFDTLDLRIIGIFVILIGALIGGFAPFVLPFFKSPSHWATLVLRSFAAGVILSLALVHVYVEGAERLESVEAFDGYPVSATCMIFGILLLVFLESMTRRWLKHLISKTAPTNPTEIDHHQEEQPEIMGKEGWSKEGKEGTSSHGHDHEHGHTHQCISVARASTGAMAHSNLTADNSSITYQLYAYMFEFACSVHSVIIGIALGVTVSGRKDAITLVIVLVFHQLFEGIGLGSTVIKAGFTFLKSSTMIVLYSLSTPIGIAAGIGIASTYDDSSLNAVVSQGVLGCISAGLLLYVALVQMIAEDFSMTENSKLWVQLASFASIVIGAGAMSVIGLWA